jgi:hypothetical protein
MSEWLGFEQLADGAGLRVLIGRLAINLLFAVALVSAIYSRVHRRHEYVFTYVLLNLVTFSLAFVLASVPMELGFALGLFAVFGILRYRTEPIAIRDLTYLVVVIGLGLLNALAPGTGSLLELLLVNAVIVGALALLELGPLRVRAVERRLRYDRLDLLAPDRDEELRADLTERTGLHVESVRVEEVDLLRDTALLVASCSTRGPPAETPP